MPWNCVQASELPPPVCLGLLDEMETGCSPHNSVQAAAKELEVACFQRLGAVLRQGGAAADRDLQAAVLRYLGPLHEMLNDRERRQLFTGLPYETVRVCTALLVADWLSHMLWDQVLAG